MEDVFKQEEINTCLKALEEVDASEQMGDEQKEKIDFFFNMLPKQKEETSKESDKQYWLDMICKMHSDDELGFVE